MTVETAANPGRGAAARLSMIEVAERLFAERGVNGVSLREIGTQAGQRNTAAARYHFGSKEALVDAVFRFRMEPVNERRLAMLAELDRTGRGTELRGLVEAFLMPLAETLGEPGRPSWYLRFCINAGLLEGIAATDLAREEWTAGVHTVRTRIDAQLGHLPPPLRADRWGLLAGYLAHALANRETFIQYGRAGGLTPRPAFLSHLVDTAVALVAAPVSPETAARLPRRTP
ncbi:TetR/AcrR family transcriptional regulator [Yinghuangia soli]|uniref:TetR/AcrR family transcriptional regulator n=1 Tax=Yinghuangia soli TaxID=2908204 RepID=UPI00254654FF|nr:TetR/AcrR family transcriptional regulator [Yinghuangia soli]